MLNSRSVFKSGSIFCLEFISVFEFNNEKAGSIFSTFSLLLWLLEMFLFCFVNWSYLSICFYLFILNIFHLYYILGDKSTGWWMVCFEKARIDLAVRFVQTNLLFFSRFARTAGTIPKEAKGWLAGTSPPGPKARMTATGDPSPLCCSYSTRSLLGRSANFSSGEMKPRDNAPNLSKKVLLLLPTLPPLHLLRPQPRGSILVWMGMLLEMIMIYLPKH